jgi:hypothetical protein
MTEELWGFTNPAIQACCAVAHAKAICTSSCMQNC